MGKGKAKGSAGKGAGRGGFFGIFDAIGQIAYCLCCLMIIGPILILIGFSFIAQAASDQRSTSIKSYDSAVSLWNSGPGADGSFQNLVISAKLTNSQTTSTVLLGSVAPEPLGDGTLRSTEKFTTVLDPWFYATSANDASITTVYPTYDKGSSVTLTFEGDSVTTTSTTLFYPIVGYEESYSWYCSGSSSSSSSSSRRRRRRSSSSDSCSNTCNNPNEPFSRQDSSKQDCEDWCTSSTVGGTWTDNGNCYESTSNAATGCCMSHWGAVQVCHTATILEKGKVSIAASPCETSQNLQVKSTDGTVLYGKMKSVNQWGQGMEISVRHFLDPYIEASKITNGCSSGTTDAAPTYLSGINAPTSESSQCFGSTPAQLLQTASIFIVCGACLSFFPAAIICVLMKKSTSNNNHNNHNNGNSSSNNYAVNNQRTMQQPIVVGQYNNQQQVPIPQAVYVNQGQPQYVQAQPVAVQAQAQPMPVYKN